MNLKLLAAALSCAVVASSAQAELGAGLTPIGAEKAANKDGSIPEWTGGLTKAPAGFKPDTHYADPFADEKPLFTITPADVGKYQDKLSPGQVALFQKNPTYKMNVYPTHRTAAFPQAVYDETALNPGRAKLSAGGNGVVGATGGVPFPAPKEGVEGMWNMLTRYRGETLATNWAQVPMTRDGNFTPVRFAYEYAFQYGSLKIKPEDRAPNLIVYFLQRIIEPARLAGFVLLVHETLDQVAQPRTAWTYNPGQRRVRLAPDVAYDNPGTAADGLRTSDDFFAFSGATDRYNWKLIGKKELYIPYNSYKLDDPKLKLGDICKKGHINQDLARYELHRVWVVEGTLKSGVSHVYSKRVYYLDEDSWTPAVFERYDARGELWRPGEIHALQLYDKPFPWYAAELHYDLQAGRYLAMGLANEEPFLIKEIDRTAADFTPQNLRNVGTR